MEYKRRGAYALINVPMVQIVPIWNINTFAFALEFQRLCSNCTYMEYKALAVVTASYTFCVQIVPIWNINETPSTIR